MKFIKVSGFIIDPSIPNDPGRGRWQCIDCGEYFAYPAIVYSLRVQEFDNELGQKDVMKEPICCECVGENLVECEKILLEIYKNETSLRNSDH